MTKKSAKYASFNPEKVADADLETAYIVLPFNQAKQPSREIEYIQEEAEGLARAIYLDVIKSEVVKYQRVNSSLFIGKGKVEEIAAEIEELKPTIVIVNHSLSPVQQRNLEKAWNTKVIDRTGLILEIFGERARTKEGTLQVELAALEYQRSRLVRSWTHLERQRGGAGFMGGPGERQIELDRRIISQRITKIKKELENVRRTRDLGRKSRERVPFPIVSLVGYTNAGKSTLFNNLTDAKVFAEDLPFATLDPTMRSLVLPNKQETILADTVGFISDLPTHLVAAFRATLEQIVFADVILHVIDVSREDFREQRDDVIEILRELNVDYDNDPRIIEIYNKVDLLPKTDQAELKRYCKFGGFNACAVSALTGQGKETLLKEIVEITARHREDTWFELRHEDGKALAWLYENAEVHKTETFKNCIRAYVQIDEPSKNQFTSYYGYWAENKPVKAEQF